METCVSRPPLPHFSRPPAALSFSVLPFPQPTHPGLYRSLTSPVQLLQDEGMSAQVLKYLPGDELKEEVRKAWEKGPSKGAASSIDPNVARWMQLKEIVGRKVRGWMGRGREGLRGEVGRAGYEVEGGRGGDNAACSSDHE